MAKKISVIVLILVTALMLTLSCAADGTGNDQAVIIGMNGIKDLNEAVSSLKNNAGNAVIYHNGSTALSYPVEIPAGLSGLKSITLASLSGQPVTVSMNGGVICANGVSFTIGEGVTLANGFLIGGSCLAQAGNVSCQSSDLVVNGTADYVIGGGLAMTKGAVSNVQDVNIVINGTANIVHGGGYAYDGGITRVSGEAKLLLARNGRVTEGIYGGGYATGRGSESTVRSARVTSQGTAKTVRQNEGRSENSGSATVGSSNNQVISRPTPTNAYVPIIEIVQPTQVIPQNYATVIYVGPGQQAKDLNEAVNLLPRNAGAVEFCVMSNFYQTGDVIIPTNRGITSLIITGNNNTLKTVTWGENGSFFANGIPTTIDTSIRFKEGIIYGGADIAAGQKSTLKSTYLEIAGTVSRVIAGSKASGNGAEAHVIDSVLVFRGKANSWLHGGGGALYGGLSMIDNMAALYILPGAVVDFSVSGGGYAFGAGARSVTQNAYMDISGNITYAVFLGGYADQSSSSVVNGRSMLYLQSGANVSQSVWLGGRAYTKSEVYLDTAAADIQGHIGQSVHRYGNATGGGKTTTRVIE